MENDLCLIKIGIVLTIFHMLLITRYFLSKSRAVSSLYCGMPPIDKDMHFFSALFLSYIILQFCYDIGAQTLDDQATIFDNKNIEDETEASLNSRHFTRGEIKQLNVQKIKDLEKFPNNDVKPITNRTKPLMLVLPFNSDTTNNLQELYSRPPVTKVILNSSIPKELTQVNISREKIGKLSIGVDPSPTTYKPIFYPKNLEKSITITTYRPIISRIDIKNYILKNAKLEERKSENNLNIKPEKYSSHYSAEKDNVISSKVNPFKFQKNSYLVNTNTSAKLDNTTKSDPTENRHQSTSDISFKPILYSLSKHHQTKIDESNPLVSMSFKPKANDFTKFKPIIIKDNANIEPGIQKYLYRYRLLQKAPKFLNGHSENEKKLNAIPSKIEISRRIDNDSEIISDDNPKILNLDNYNQLQKLLQNIQELQRLNRTLHEDSFGQAGQKKLNSSFNDEHNESGPNPNSLQDNRDIDLKSKHEFKRQNNAKTDSSEEGLISTEESITGSTDINDPTTEASKDETLSNLENSFGGSDDLDPITEEALPPPKTNGFYFLADVNKFLEVGQDEDKVVVKFSQKIGDPSRFIPVKIPK